MMKSNIFVFDKTTALLIEGYHESLFYDISISVDESVIKELFKHGSLLFCLTDFFITDE